MERSFRVCCGRRRKRTWSSTRNNPRVFKLPGYNRRRHADFSYWRPCFSPGSLPEMLLSTTSLSMRSAAIDLLSRTEALDRGQFQTLSRASQKKNGEMPSLADEAQFGDRAARRSAGLRFISALFCSERLRGDGPSAGWEIAMAVPAPSAGVCCACLRWRWRRTSPRRRYSFWSLRFGVDGHRRHLAQRGRAGGGIVVGNVAAEGGGNRRYGSQRRPVRNGDNSHVADGYRRSLALDDARRIFRRARAVRAGVCARIAARLASRKTAADVVGAPSPTRAYFVGCYCP